MPFPIKPKRTRRDFVLHNMMLSDAEDALRSGLHGLFPGSFTEAVAA